MEQKSQEEETNEFRYADGAVRLRNPNIELMDQDILYHLALGSESHDLHHMFGDVKFVCMGGTPKRMEQFANYIMSEIGYKLPAGTTLHDISQYSYRYSMYKIGPVLSISHGMGIPSVGILLHEVIKLMYHARVKDPVFFRLGTCGGIGLDGGQLVITNEAVDGLMRPFLELPVLGKLVQRPAKLDENLAEELKSLSTQDDPFETHVGRTMCTYDFYEGQGRLDGAFCDYTEKEKLDFLNQISDQNVINMEMESLAFAALTHHAGIRAAVLCVTLLNRLNGDQVASSKEVMEEWQSRPQMIVARYIKKHLGMTGPVPRPPPPGPKTVINPKKMKIVREESQSYE